MIKEYTSTRDFSVTIDKMLISVPKGAVLASRSDNIIYYEQVPVCEIKSLCRFFNLKLIMESREQNGE